MVQLSFAALVASAATLVSSAALPRTLLNDCPIVADGRVPLLTPYSTFDTSSSKFNPDYVKGYQLKWSNIIKYPLTLASRFDLLLNKAIEVTINDASIFAPGGLPGQVGFRRAELLLTSNNGTDASTFGVKTIHWSVKQDWTRPLNYSHEYQNVFMETNTYDATQFTFEAGVLLGSTDKAKAKWWKILGRSGNVLFTTPIDFDDWQNFALTLDFNKNTIQVYYSKGYDKLKSVTKKVANNNAGGGQIHFGVLKKPTETITVVNDGYQESKINEGQIYGGIFVEDSANGCISE